MKVPKPQQKSGVLHYLDRALEIGSDTADVLVHLGQGLTPVGVAAVGIRVIERYRSLSEKSAYDWLEKGWELMHVFGLESFLFEVCAFHSTPQLVDGVSTEEGLVTTVLFDEFTFAWIYMDDYLMGPWVAVGSDHDTMRQTLGRTVWEHIKSNRAVLVQRGDDEDLIPSVIADEDAFIFPSKLGDEVLSRVQEFNAAGFHRSIVFLGEPGTGKTCLIKYIARQFGGFSLRIRAHDFDDLDARQILGIVKLLSPATVSIDDFDRLEGHETLLSELEDLNKTVKLFMVSCNDLDEIPDAVFRPGRFDEVKLIKTLDDDVLDKVLDGIELKPRQRSLLREMPIAYVVEFSKRYQTLGPEKAVAEIKNLFEHSYKLRHMVESELSNKKARLRRRSAPARTPRQRIAQQRRRVASEESQMARSEIRVDKAKQRLADMEAKIAKSETSTKKRTKKKRKGAT